MTPTFIDLYCERIEAGLWNEPANALTNVVFIIAAMLAWKVIRSRAQSDIWEKLIVCLAGMIGIGSFLFHTFATSWAAQADIIPIWAFVIGYAVLTTYRLCEHNVAKTLKIIVAAVITMVLFKSSVYTLSGTNSAANIAGTLSGQTSAFQDAQGSVLNGSEQYLPALFALLIVTVACLILRHSARKYFVSASLLFCASLFFRTIDHAACEATNGLGTHFLWHLINGFVVASLLLALVKTMPPKQRLSDQ